LFAVCLQHKTKNPINILISDTYRVNACSP
jgi:hypothetical protein